MADPWLSVILPFAETTAVFAFAQPSVTCDFVVFLVFFEGIWRRFSSKDCGGSSLIAAVDAAAQTSTWVRR